MKLKFFCKVMIPFWVFYAVILFIEHNSFYGNLNKGLIFMLYSFILPVWLGIKFTKLNRDTYMALLGGASLSIIPFIFYTLPLLLSPFPLSVIIGVGLLFILVPFTFQIIFSVLSAALYTIYFKKKAANATLVKHNS